MTSTLQSTVASICLVKSKFYAFFNSKFFDACDGIFLNYTWKDADLDNSKELALSTYRAYDVYVGIDVFGRGCRGGGGYNTKEVCLL